jgi:hypothetical protein
MLTAKDTADWVPELKWNLKKQYVLKNHFMVLDLLANNDWKRPIYFAVTTGPDSYVNLQDYFRLEGLAYRLVPCPGKSQPQHLWYRGHGHHVQERDEQVQVGRHGLRGAIYLDENVLRMTTNLRLQLATLADALVPRRASTRRRKRCLT